MTGNFHRTNCEFHPRTPSHGTIIAADKNNHQIKFIAEDGRVLLVLGSGAAEKGANLFTTPEGVEIRGELLWISDSGNDRVVKYRNTVP